MLEGVVLRGTAKAARMDGYPAAGKTGTAEKIIDGRYHKSKNIASFAGFVPTNKPEIVCIVSIDEPVGARHGGDVAAPIFAQAVAKALQILNVAPEGEEAPPALLAEDVRTYEVPQLLNEFAPASEPGATGQDLAAAPTQTQEPASNVIEPAKKAARPRSGDIVVPDLNGRGIREAVALLASRGLKIQASGEGIVTGQSPPPGTYVTKEAICKVNLAKPKVKKEPPSPLTTSPKPPAATLPPKGVTGKKR